MNNWVISKIWAVVILIILVGGGFFTWQYFQTSKEEVKAPEEIIPKEVDEIANWKIYTYGLEGRSYTIKYPKDWLIVPGADAPLSSNSTIGIENNFVAEKENICFGLGCLMPGIIITDRTFYHFHTTVPTNLLKEPYPTFESLMPDFLSKEDMNIAENKVIKFVVNKNNIIYLLYNPNKDHPFFLTINVTPLTRTGPDDQLIEYARIAERILSTFKFNKTSPEIRTGVFLIEHNDVTKIQELVNRGDQLWRLSAEKALSILALDYGFTEEDLGEIRWFSTFPTEGIIQYTVPHKDKNYIITMAQPVIGPGKIWVILRILED